MKKIVLVFAVLVSSFGFGQSSPGDRIANDVGNYMANSPTFYRGEAKFDDMRGILETILTNPQLAKKMIMQIDPAILDVLVWGHKYSQEPAEQHKTLPRFGDVIDALPAIMAGRLSSDYTVIYVCNCDDAWKLEEIYIMHKDNSEIADFNIKFCYGNGTDRLVSVIVEERFGVLTKTMLSKYQN
jgi:hypothetical protein